MSESDQMMFARISMRFSTNFEGRMLDPAAADETSKLGPTIRLPSVPAEHLGKKMTSEDPTPKKKKKKDPVEGYTTPEDNEKDSTIKDSNNFECLFSDCNNASFETKKLLKRHLKSHVGETYYECDLCNLRFTTNLQLALHNHSHTHI